MQPDDANPTPSVSFQPGQAGACPAINAFVAKVRLGTFKLITLTQGERHLVIAPDAKAWQENMSLRGRAPLQGPSIP